MTNKNVIRFHYQDHPCDLAQLRVCASALSGFLGFVYEAVFDVSVTPEGVFAVTNPLPSQHKELLSSIADFIRGFLEDGDERS